MRNEVQIGKASVKNQAIRKLEKEDQTKPFVLLFAEKHAGDLLKRSNVAFSEAVDGMSAETAAENFETTQMPGRQDEGADTTFGG